MDPRPHIVVVEDEAVQRQVLAEYLARQNFRVSAIDSGAALHRLVEGEAPAVVLLDVGLPEAIAEPGGICLSAAAYEQIRGKLEIAVADMGEQDLKNIARPLRTYRVVL